MASAVPNSQIDMLATLLKMGFKTGDTKHLEGYAEQLATAAASLKARQASHFVFEPTARERSRLRERAAYLRTLPQAEQCTPEWFAYRRGAPGEDGIYTGGRLTASDTGTVLGMNEYACPEEIIVKKAGRSTFNWSPACEHGKKYENVTLAIFERREGKCVHEYGCIDGADGITAASPDGITVSGDAVEIKNPSGRRVTGVPKPAYYAQIQQQLQVLDLELCHFVETEIREYDDRTAYRNDCPHGETDAPWTAAGNEKGVLLEIVDAPPADAPAKTPPSFHYVYAPLGIRPSEVGAWLDSELDRLGDLPDSRSVLVKFWHLDVYCNTPILRDRVWWAQKLPELHDFWRRVEEARRDPAALAHAMTVYEEFREAKEVRFGRVRKPTRDGRHGRTLQLELGDGAAVAAVAEPEGACLDNLFGPDTDM